MFRTVSTISSLTLKLEIILYTSQTHHLTGNDDWTRPKRNTLPGSNRQLPWPDLYL